MILSFSVEARRKRSKLTLLDEHGGLMDDVNGVKSTVKNHLVECFVEPLNNQPVLGGLDFKQVYGEANVSLMAPFEEDEIKEGEWIFDGDKSLGPYNFSLRFIKEY